MSESYLPWLISAVIIGVYVFRRIRTTCTNRAALAKFHADHMPQPDLRVVGDDERVPRLREHRIDVRKRVVAGAAVVAAGLGVGSFIAAPLDDRAEASEDVEPAPIIRTNRTANPEPQPTSHERRAHSSPSSSQQNSATREPPVRTTTPPAPKPTRSKAPLPPRSLAPSSTTSSEAPPPQTTTTETEAEAEVSHSSVNRSRSEERDPRDNDKAKQQDDDDSEPRRQGLVGAVVGLITP